MRPIAITCCCLLLLTGCNLFSETVAVDMSGSDAEVGDLGSRDAGGSRDVESLPDAVVDDMPSDMAAADTGSNDMTAADMASADTGSADTGSPDVGGPDLAGFEVPEGLVEYDFETIVDGTVPDISSAPTYDLTLVGTGSKTSGGVFLSAAAALETSEPPAEFVDAVMASGEFAVSMWVAADATDQGGDRNDTATNVRMFTISADSGSRNLTIAQFFEAVLIRVRTDGTDSNGLPQVLVADVFQDTGLHHHLVQVRGGMLEYYFDGQLMLREPSSGDVTGWNTAHRMRLGNEFESQRPWAGAFSELRLYGSALSGDTVAKIAAAGPQ